MNDNKIDFNLLCQKISRAPQISQSLYTTAVLATSTIGGDELSWPNRYSTSIRMRQ